MVAAARRTTWNVAGRKLKESPVLLLNCEKEMVVDPWLNGVMVSPIMSSQLPKVTELGLTVATLGALDSIDTTRVSWPWKNRTRVFHPHQSGQRRVASCH